VARPEPIHPEVTPPNSQEVIVISDNEDSDEDSDEEDANDKQPETEDTTVQRTARSSSTTRTWVAGAEFDYYTSPKRRRESQRILDAAWKSAIEKFQNAQDVVSDSLVDIETIVIENHKGYKNGQPYQGREALKQINAHMDVVRDYIDSVASIFKGLGEKEADQQYHMADGDEKDEEYKPRKSGRSKRSKL
jgi:hypothetical protein